MATKEVAKAARSASGAIPVYKKYTVQSTGLWETIRKTLSVDPNRSTGVPLNLQYRNPPPGAADAARYDDPVTLPAGDIAENSYFKRDVRRSYPKLSFISQADVVGLLSVGSQAAPKQDTPLIGEAGAKQLVAIRKEGEENGLASLFEKDKKSVTSVLAPNGMPPLPSGLSSLIGVKRYEKTEESAYPEEYPCRTFQ